MKKLFGAIAIWIALASPAFAACPAGWTGFGACANLSSGDVTTALTYTPYNPASFGTGVATALGLNIGSAGAPIVFNGALGTPSSGTAAHITGLPISTGVSGLGTGVGTALGVNVGSAGSIIVNGGALGTPSSGTGTNITGIPAANILSGALVNGMTATTQTVGDNTTAVATDAFVIANAGGGGGSLTVTGGGGSVSSTTTEAFGNGFLVSGGAGTANVTMTLTDTTKTSSYAAAAGDMANALNLAGSGAALTLPAESSTIFAPGMTLGITTAAASGNWTLTNSTGLTMTGLNSTTLVPGTVCNFTANVDASHLDAFCPMQVPSTTVLGGLLALSGATSNEVVSYVDASGVQHLVQIGFSNLSGSIATGQIPSGTVTLAQQANLAANSIQGNNTGSPGVPLALTATQATAMLNTVTTSVKGLAPTLPNDATKYLDGTGNYSVPAGSGTGCIVSGTVNQVLEVATGGITCVANANFSVVAGAATLGASGTAGSVAMGNASSGTVTLQPVTGALGSVTASLPANTGTIAELNLAQAFTATQTFAGVLGENTTQSGSTYTLAATDCGTTVVFTSASAVTVTIPSSIVPAAGTTCNISIWQSGAGQVAVNGSAVTPATLVNAHSYTKTYGQNAEIGLSLTTIGGTATANLTGDGA